MDLIEIPENFFDVGPALSLPPRVYYDADTGGIRGVSFTEDDSLSDHPYMHVSEDDATQLMTGAKSVAEWMVDVTNETPALVKVYGAVEFDVLSIDDIGILTSDDRRVSPVTLKISIPRNGKYVGFQFQAFSPHWTIETNSKEKLYFVLTRRGNPQAVLGVYHISVKELAARDMITVRVPSEAGELIDIYTKRVSPLNYEIEIVDRIRPILKVPFAFEDIRRAMPPPEIIPPSLVVDRSGDKLEFRLHNGGGAIFDRRIERMMVSLCAPGDPHQLLHFSWIDVKALDSQKVELPIPPGLLSTKFDVCAQLLYNSFYDVRNSNN